MSEITTGEYLTRLLEAYSVDFVFGIPGVHTIELYRGIAHSQMRHITPRHEQGAGFMADGYARVSKKPGVCFVITGPGLSNIATAMLQARADSIPMLVISSVNNPERETRGNLHEILDQSAFAKTVAIDSFLIEKPEDLAPALSRTFEIFEHERPGPVHIEVPLNVMKLPADHLMGDIKRTHLEPPSLPLEEIEKAAKAINQASDLAILAGGGSSQAGPEIIKLAEHLNAPVVTTTNARSTFDHNHPLVLSKSPSFAAVSEFVGKADVVLAIGTELGATDYDFGFFGQKITYKSLIRIDIDKTRLNENAKADIGITGDAKRVAEALLERTNPRETHERADIIEANKATWERLTDTYQSRIKLLENIRDKIPNLLMVGDSTELIYAGNLAFAPDQSGAWFNSATGYGTLGFALSAATGAKLASPDKPVLAIMGDGGLQFSLGELGAARDYGAGIVLLLWNNDGYGEIKNFMIEADVEPEGVDFKAPDFNMIAAAYGIKAETVTDLSTLPDVIARTFETGETTIVEARLI